MCHRLITPISIYNVNVSRTSTVSFIMHNTTTTLYAMCIMNFQNKRKLLPKYACGIYSIVVLEKCGSNPIGTPYCVSLMVVCDGRTNSRVLVENLFNTSDPRRIMHVLSLSILKLQILSDLFWRRGVVDWCINSKAKQI